jgi:hypothetical protein
MDHHQQQTQPTRQANSTQTDSNNQLPSLSSILGTHRRPIHTEPRRSSVGPQGSLASRPSLRASYGPHSSPTIVRIRNDASLATRQRGLPINKLLNQPTESPQLAKESAPPAAEETCKSDQNEVGGSIYQTMRQLTFDQADIGELCRSELENVKSLLTCKICYSMLYEPYTTSCGHTYCYNVCVLSCFMYYIANLIVSLQIFYAQRP